MLGLQSQALRKVAQALESGLEVKLTERPREGKVRAGGGGGPFGSPEAASGEGGACLRHPSFPGPSRPLTGGCRGPYGRGSDSEPRFGVPGYPGRIPFHPREASLPPPLLAGFMRGSSGIRRNSMRAGPCFRPRKGLPLREGAISRRWPGGAGPQWAGVARTSLCVKTRQLGGSWTATPWPGWIANHSESIANESDTAT